MLAAKLVYIVIGELSKRKGLDIEELIDDEEIYEDLVDTLIDEVDITLRTCFEKLLDKD